VQDLSQDLSADRAQSRPEWQRVIGIIGGLGPHAHVEFETLLLSATEAALGRQLVDQDYPAWVLSSLPSTPDRTGAVLEDTASPVDALVRSAKRLSSADFAVIPCNTAHAFLDDVRERVAIPLLDMIRVTAEEAVNAVGPQGTVGILAASGTLRSGIYADRIHAIDPDVSVISPLDLDDGAELQRRLVMEPIFGDRGIKAGAFRDPERREQLAEPMRDATRKLAAAGAQIVLTACTEIPLVLGRDVVDDTALIDPMAVAAERAIDIALGRRELPGASS
jgi:aspartate racemase